MQFICQLCPDGLATRVGASVRIWLRTHVDLSQYDLTCIGNFNSGRFRQAQTLAIMECIHWASASPDWLIIIELYVTLDLVRHVLMARVQLVSSISDCKSRVVPNLWMRLNIFTDGHFDKDIAMTYLGASLALAMPTVVS